MKSDQVLDRFTEDNMVFLMGEELKKPLTAIQALAESESGSSSIRLEARKALRTIDNILLYQQVSSNQTRLAFEPVHIGSSLNSIQKDLKPLSLERGCETEIFIQSGLSAVDTDARLLRSGLESMWQAVLGMTERPSALVWNVYRTTKGIRIAITNNSLNLDKVFINTKLRDSSKQPISGIAGPATDLLVARETFNMLGVSLSKIHKEGARGLAVTLPVSSQLAMI